MNPLKRSGPDRSSTTRRRSARHAGRQGGRELADHYLQIRIRRRPGVPGKAVVAKCLISARSRLATRVRERARTIGFDRLRPSTCVEERLRGATLLGSHRPFAMGRDRLKTIDRLRVVHDGPHHHLLGDGLDPAQATPWPPFKEIVNLASAPQAHDRQTGRRASAPSAATATCKATAPIGITEHAPRLEFLDKLGATRSTSTPPTRARATTP